MIQISKPTPYPDSLVQKCNNNPVQRYLLKDAKKQKPLWIQGFLKFKRRKRDLNFFKLKRVVDVCVAKHTIIKIAPLCICP